MEGRKAGKWGVYNLLVFSELLISSLNSIWAASLHPSLALSPYRPLIPTPPLDASHDSLNY